MTPRELINKLLEHCAHDLDEEIKVCLMSHKDDEVSVDFRITEVDENKIYIRERGVTSEKKIFQVPLPKDKELVQIYKRLDIE
tara:strand:+ start:1989 stop:2237 length:249 start_codon:yes stop_codon:yes gene_type:complete